MDVGWQIKIVILFFLFVFSAFFSGSEVALFSLNRKRLKSSTDAVFVTTRYLLRLLEHPRRLLVTILIGNTVVNVAASIVAVFLTLDIVGRFNYPRDIALTIQIIALTIIIVLFGELIPKVWASKNPVSFAKFVSIPLYWINVILYPVAETLTEIIKSAVSRINFDKSKSAILPEELAELANLSHERGTIIEEEHGLINSIVSFRTVAAHEVMTPRMDMIAVSTDTDFDELLRIITQSGHSRLPLYRNGLDDIVGIVYAKDILPYIQNKELRRQFSLEKIARKALFVPQTKLISTLMQELQEKKMHISIVVDEYGGTSGLITLEDIIEEIIGEIRDEYDREENAVQKINDNTYVVLGKLSIDELNELLNTNIQPENEDYETVAGLVLNYAGHIPREGYSFEMENHKFTVKEVLKKRIMKILVERQSSE
ncbi:MAG TPA: hemolysin family protein [Ignavibacteriaceae bacterium]|nr:hemolysin family protein [Ignavibacteriaceae bacterium]